jgi:hypothetical protein
MHSSAPSCPPPSNSKQVIKTDKWLIKPAARSSQRPAGARSALTDFSCSAVQALPQVPPEKWLIKKGPRRRRYETVKVFALQEVCPSLTAPPLRPMSPAVSDAGKLVSASYNVKVIPHPSHSSGFGFKPSIHSLPPPHLLLLNLTSGIALCRLRFKPRARSVRNGDIVSL